MKSARSKACDIPQSVKEKVYARDNGLCIICSMPGLPNAHYISRQRGGLGIEQNIVTLCPRCHYRYDYGGKADHTALGLAIKEYLLEKYPNFNEKDLIFKKWSDIK